jgi:hypothetical protein
MTTSTEETNDIINSADISIEEPTKTSSNKSNGKKHDGKKHVDEPEPSHNMEGRYVALLETNGEENEQWYYFIRYEGNEENLQHLQDQLEKVDWYVLDDLSTFDLDLEHFVCAQTAKEMTKLELNTQWNRKFDGKLEKIDLGFKKKDKNDKMITRTFDMLGYGQIEDFIDDEDIDPEDLADSDEEASESESESESNDTENDSDSDSESSASTPPKKTKQKKDREKGIPPALLADTRPGWAKAKGKKARKKG